MKRLSPTRHMRGVLALSSYDRLEHVGLAHEKLAPHNTQLSADARSEFIRGLGSHTRVPRPYPAAFRRWVRRTPRLMDEGPLGREVLLVVSGGRVLCGLGEQTPTENGLSIHQTYGVPYLPGSSLKGITKRYLAENASGAWGQGGAVYRGVFGEGPEDDADDEGGSSGLVHFLDALWVPGDPDFPDTPFAAEILTPHHSQYYQGKAPPDGTQSPIPVTFLAAQGAFRVVLEGPPSLLELLRPVVVRALAERGVGAKSRGGYGRFQTLDRLTKDDDLLVREHEEQREREKVRQRFAAAKTPAEVLAALTLEGAEADRQVEQFSRWLTAAAGTDPRLAAYALTPESALATWDWVASTLGVKGLWKKVRAELREDVRAALEAQFSGGDDGASSGGFGTNHLDSFDVPKGSKKKKAAWPNRFATRIAGGGFDRDTVLRAIAHLRAHGGKDGHVKKILEAYGIEE